MPKRVVLIRHDPARHDPARHNRFMGFLDRLFGGI
jgi:hypothetical protein